MAYIKVDHKKLEKAAETIDQYVSRHRKRNTAIDSEITQLKSSWSGTDYDTLKLQWQEMNGKDSTSQKLIQTMETQADNLRFAAGKYKEAQSRAVNRAKLLPKY